MIGQGSTETVAEPVEMMECDAGERPHARETAAEHPTCMKHPFEELARSGQNTPDAALTYLYRDLYAVSKGRTVSMMFSPVYATFVS
jgi:hypothetical protein